MTWKRTAHCFLLILPFLLLALWPADAPAQGPDATLYEVTETMRLKGNKMTHRLATAALMGWVKAGSPICPLFLFDPLLPEEEKRCAINAVGSNNVNLATGKGPFRGSFAIVMQGDNEFDGPELMLVRGTFHGIIDFSLAVLGLDGDPATPDNLPIGFFTKARWNARGVAGGPLAGLRANGKLEGTFRQPFDGAAFGFPGVICYLQNDMTLIPADTVAEFSLGVPTVKVEIDFQE